MSKMEKENKKEKVQTDRLYDISRSGLPKLRIDENSRYLSDIPKYITNNGEIKSLDIARDTGTPLILVGPTGVSKTHLLQFYAQENKIPYVAIDCSNISDSGDLIGKQVLLNGNWVYSLGVIPIAIEIANRLGKCMLVFEEINALNPDTQKMINSIRDFRKNVTVTQLDETYKLEKGVQLLICGTMNYGNGYQGINELNTDFKSGFMFEIRGYPPVDVEQKILEEFTHLDKKLIRLSIQLAVMTRNDENLDQKISPKHLVKFGLAYDSAIKLFKQDTDLEYKDNEALQQALRMTILNEYFEKQHRAKLSKWIYDIFKIDLEPELRQEVEESE